MRHFIDLLDWDGEQILKLLKDAARLKKAHAQGQAQAAPGGQGPRHDLREAVAAHARQLPGGHGPARRAGGFPQRHRGRPRQARKPCRHRPHHVRIRRCRRPAHLPARERRRVRPLVVQADHQRPVGLLSSVPGARRSADGPRMLRRSRRQEPSPSSATATTSPARSAIACGKVGSGSSCRPARLPLRSAVPGDVSNAGAWPTRGDRRSRSRRSRQADIIYTDVWASMGQEAEASRAPQAFRGLSGERRPAQGGPGTA